MPADAQRGPIYTGVERVVAVGDLHGAYERFLAILKGAGLIDADHHWTGGRTHLVQIGDILDRGPNARDIFNLIRSLEGEAAAAGGRVHMLIGNHEALVIMGMTFSYTGFVTVEQFLSFLPDRYRQRKEEEFRRRAGPDGDLRPFWEKLLGTDLEAQSVYYNFFRERYGRWIADHDTAIKIDDTVFVHGGFNEEYSRRPLENLNRAVSMELLDFMMNRTASPKILFDPHGPLWYRENASSDENLLSGEIDRVLANLKAKVLVVGHTATAGSLTGKMDRFGGRVWTIDTRIWDPFSGRLDWLNIENGKFERRGIDHEYDSQIRGGRGGRAAAHAGPGPAVR
jgi:hypothetical protein